jgi:protein-S-isoprenylcysteine O-methyltransferase Ste14
VDHFPSGASTRTFLIVIPPLAACAALIFRVRARLVGADLGANWILIGIAMVLTGVSLWLEPQCWKHVSLALLAGVPELSPSEQGRSKLVQQGIYRVVRHPRYVSAGISVLASALFVNHLGVYLLLLLVVPAGLVMVVFEERELVGRFGEGYRQYQRDVPRFIPRRRGKSASVGATAVAVAGASVVKEKGIADGPRTDVMPTAKRP